MNHFYNDASEERFQHFPKWKQEKIIEYAQLHDAKIGIHAEFCRQVMYLYKNHYQEKWQYARDGLHLFNALFLLPNNTVTDGEKVIFPEKVEPVYTPPIPTRHIIKESWICKTNYPNDSEMDIYLRQFDDDSCSLFSIPNRLPFQKESKVPGSLYKTERDGKTEYEYAVGYKQVKFHIPVSEELYNYITYKIKTI